MNESIKYILYLFLSICCLVGGFYLPIYVLAPKFWPRKIENESLFAFSYAMINHEVVFLVQNLFYIVIYNLEWPFFEQFKIEKDAWPWKADKEKWKITLSRTIKLVLFNHLVVIPLMAVGNLINNYAPVRVDYESLPGITEVVWQYLFCFVMDDFCFYWSHRLLHWDRIYPYIHKIHHEHRITVSIASEYAHPVEYLFGNIIPSNIGMLLLGKRAHLLSSGIYTMFKIAGSIQAHSGYDFPFLHLRLTSALPMWASGEYHSYHHLKFKGNYGNSKIWDTLLSTLHPKYLEESEKREKIKYKIS